MATQEFYIRTASETEAHGPFTQEQLISLAEAGKVDAQTLYYEAGTEQWVTIGSNPDLKTSVFPEKKRLILKPKESINRLNEGPDTHPPITVDEMLAAAEGRTADTRSKQDMNIAYERAARIGRYACTLMLFMSAVSLLLPHIDIIAAFDTGKLAAEPFVYLGAIDLFLVLMLLLGALNFYPFIRFRAALGFGFIATMFWLQGQEFAAGIAGVASLGLYLTTVFVSYVPLAGAVGLGLVGMAGFAYFMLT